MPPKQNPGASKQDYSTPKDFVNKVKYKLGLIDFKVDLAADETNSKGQFYVTEEINSLAQSWPQLIGDEWGWLNPPYADIRPWAEKCATSAKDGANIAFLVPASVGSNWFRDYCWNKAFVLYLNGRLAFIPDKPNWLYPKDLMLVLYNGWAVGSDVWNWRV